MTSENFFRIAALFKGSRVQLAGIIICLIVTAIISIVQPLVNRCLIDDGIVAYNAAEVVKWTFITALILIVSCAADLLKEVIRASLAAKIQRDLFMQSYKALISLPTNYFKSRNSGELLNDIHIDITKLGEICDSNTFSSLTQLLSFVGGIVGLFIISPALASLVLIFVPIKVCMVYLLGKRRRFLVKKLIATNNAFAHWFGDNINHEAMKILRLFGLSKLKKTELQYHVSSVTSNEKSLIIIGTLNGTLDTLIMGIIICSIYLTGSNLIFSDSITIGSLFAFVAFSIQVMNPLGSILNLHFVINGIIPSAERFFRFIDEGSEGETPHGDQISSINDIEFKNIRFSYGDKLVLDKFELSVKKSDKIAIIGRNGIGKSSIFQLLERFEVPKKGSITIGCKPIESLNISSYRSLISCVNQNNYLYDDTIKSNILLGSNYSDSRLDSIIGICQLNQLYQEHIGTIGENGSRLSGGQRQRILIARALLREASVYLFDEASNSLDSNASNIIKEAMSTILKDKIVFIITHDTNILSECTKVIELIEPGKIEIRYPKQ